MYTATHTVLACATATPQLAAPLNIRVPIIPVKGYSITLPLSSDRATPPRTCAIDVAVEKHVYISPLGDRLRVGGFAELAGFDMTIAESMLGRLRRVACGLYPSVASANGFVDDFISSCDFIFNFAAGM